MHLKAEGSSGGEEGLALGRGEGGFLKQDGGEGRELRPRIGDDRRVPLQRHGATSFVGKSGLARRYPTQGDRTALGIPDGDRHDPPRT